MDAGTKSGQEVVGLVPGVGFADDIFVVGRDRVRQTQRQKRLEKRKHAAQSRGEQGHALD